MYVGPLEDEEVQLLRIREEIGQLYIPNFAVSHILYEYGGDQISSSAEFPLIDKCQYH